MDNRIKDNKLDGDLKTIVECEVDSAKEECNEDFDFGDNFQHLELRSHQDRLPNFDIMKTPDINFPPYEEQKVPHNLFGSRTYTSPASVDSSSGNSCPFRGGEYNDNNFHLAPQKFTNRKSNSKTSKLRSDQQSEKFIMLRNFVENIDDPLKRQMLLDFLDNSTLKTEYVTLIESSSSGEEVKGLRKITKFSKSSRRRHKSPLSVIPKSTLGRRKRNAQAYSQERKRFSLAKPKVKTMTGMNHHLHNFKIERKNGSDDWDSKNGDKWYTEESKEVPLEAILYEIHHQRKHRSRAQSGYSASRDEATTPGDEIHRNAQIFDINMGADLEACKPHKRKDIIVLPWDLIEEDKNTDEMAKMKIITRWFKKFRGVLIFLLIFAVISLAFHNVYLEVKVHSYPKQIYELDREINELHKSNAEWKDKYEQWAADPSSFNSESTTSFGENPTKNGNKVIFAKSTSP